MGKWTQDQKVQLLQLVCDYKLRQGQVDWVQISTVFANYSILQIQHAYQNSIRKEYSNLLKTKWNQKEIETVKRQINNETINWHELRKKLPDFSMNDIIQKVRQTMYDENDQMLTILNSITKYIE